jgi:thioredoxin 1
MKWLRSRWRGIGLVGLLATVVGFSFGKPGAGTLPAMPNDAPLSNIQTIKGERMAMQTQTEGKIHHANESNFRELVLESKVPVLVDFYADWCGPCRLLTPVLEEMARENTDAKIVKINVDHSPELAARYRVNAIPSLKVFDKGKVVDEHVGLANEARLRAMLDI